MIYHCRLGWSKSFQLLVIAVFGLSFFAGHTIVGTAQWKNVAPQLLTTTGRSGQWGGAILSDSGNVWAGIYSIFLSRDSGQTWGKTSATLLAGEFVEDIQCFDKRTVLVSACHFLGAYFTSRILMTSDEGLTWSQIYSAPYRVTSACFLRSADEIVATVMRVPGESYLLRSTDRGITWIKTATDGAAFDSKRAPDGTLRVLNGDPNGNTAGIRTSGDNGLTWSPYLGNIGYDSYMFQIDKCNPEYLYVVNEAINVPNTGGKRPTVHVSSNGGKTFTACQRIAGSKLAGSLTTSPAAVFAQLMDTGLIRSTDQGQTWLNIGGPKGLADSRLITAISDNLLLAVDGQGSIWRTENCGGLPIQITGPLQLRTQDIRCDTIGMTVSLPISFEGSACPTDAEFSVECDSGLVFKRAYMGDGSTLIDYGSNQLHVFRLVQMQMAQGKPSCHIDFDVYPTSYKAMKVSIHLTNFANQIAFCPYSAGETIVGNVYPPPGCGIVSLSNFIREGKIPEFNIYPNPVQNKLMVVTPTQIDNVDITISDASGKVQLETNTNAHPNRVQELNISGLAEGAYTIVFHSIGLSETRRFVIKR